MSEARSYEPPLSSGQWWPAGYKVPPTIIIIIPLQCCARTPPLLHLLSIVQCLVSALVEVFKIPETSAGWLPLLTTGWLALCLKHWLAVTVKLALAGCHCKSATVCEQSHSFVTGKWNTSMVNYCIMSAPPAPYQNSTHLQFNRTQ